GSASVTTAPVLGLGPLLVIVSVQASAPPAMTDAGAVLTSARSATRRDVVAWVVALLFGSVSVSFAVTLAPLNVVPETPAAIDSARMSYVTTADCALAIPGNVQLNVP